MCHLARLCEATSFQLDDTCVGASISLNGLGIFLGPVPSRTPSLGTIDRLIYLQFASYYLVASILAVRPNERQIIVVDFGVV